MRKILSFILLAVIIYNAHAQKTYKYTIAPKDLTVDNYFDTIKVNDPYQWMENPYDTRLSVWLDEQRKLTAKEENKQTQIWTLRAQLGAMYYYQKEETFDSYIEKDKKLKSKYVFKYDYKGYDRVPDLLYKKRDATNYKNLVKIKNFRRNKNDHVIISKKIINSDESVVVIEMSHNGSDWHEAYFFNLENGEQLSDTLKYLRTGSKIIWNKNGIYYDRYDKPKTGRDLLDKPKGQTLYYHRLGTKQIDDKPLYYNPDTTGTYSFSFFKKDSNKLFFNHIYPTRGKIYRALSYAMTDDDKSFFLKNYLIYPNNDSINFDIEVVIGDTVILSTNWNAPNGMLLKANINLFNKIEKFVPEYDIPLRKTDRLGKDKIACTYKKDGQYLVYIFNLNGDLIKTIDFPEGKAVNYFYEYNLKVDYTQFCVSSFYHPDIWYQLSLNDLTFKPSVKITIPYKPEDLETKFITFKSKDSTEIPMYITCLKKTKLDGENPTLLYGYGGYGFTIEPDFDRSLVLWLLHGGILAVPNIRGGGAEGNEWGKAGRRLKKQNSIDDFIAATEYLIQEKYTNPNKLAIKGASHGGMLVGAALTQRPELFKAAIIDAGAFDMLRFDKFTGGSMQTNMEEFGSVSNYEDFCNLRSYSPLHNIKEACVYPNILLMTGDNDDRVPPFHSYKFLASLQEKASPKSQYLLYVIPGASHSGALTVDDWVNKTLFENYFLFDQLDLKFW